MTKRKRISPEGKEKRRKIFATKRGQAKEAQAKLLNVLKRLDVPPDRENRDIDTNESESKNTDTDNQDIIIDLDTNESESEPIEEP